MLAPPPFPCHLLGQPPSWKTYTIRGTVSAGSHKVALAFTNDAYKNASQDRNLYLDRCTVVRVATTLTVSTKSLFAGGQRLAAKESTGALRVYHGDHLGSTNVITDATGAVVEAADYTPFGAVIPRPPSPAPRPFGFTGQRLDPTGLYFYHARYYDSSLGRFISADPFVQDPGDPQAFNRYAYVRNNPSNLVDPTGYDFTWLVILIFVIAVGVGVAQEAAKDDQESFFEAPPNTPPPVAPPMSEVPAGLRAASFISGFVPIVGEAQDAAGAFLAIDLITQEEITPGFQALSAATLFIPLFGSASIRQLPRLLNDTRPLRGLKRALPKGAEYVYDATAKRFRHVPSGRFVSRGDLPFPPKAGFRISSRGTLQPGTVIDRYGSPRGGFASEPGASISARGLPPGSEALEYHRYEVLRPLDVELGPAAAVPEFAATGGAKQYLFGRPISELVAEGFLKELR